MTSTAKESDVVTVIVNQPAKLMEAVGEILSVRRYCKANFHDVSPTAKSCPQCGCKKFREDPVEIGMPINLTKDLVTEHPSSAYGNFGCPLNPAGSRA